MLVSACGTLLNWRLASLNVSEREMARRLLQSTPGMCYVVGDAFYDTNRLHATAERAGVCLMAPRKHSAIGTGMVRDIKRHEPARVDCIQRLELTPTAFTIDLMKQRLIVERFFAQLTNFGGGLTGLPPWVRTYPRVHAWVQSKLIIALVRGSIPTPVRHRVA